jgi:hypothetical protein
MNLTMEDFPLGYPVNYSPIPLQYQGWVFLGFVIFGIAALLYGFYFIAKDDSFERDKI